MIPAAKAAPPAERVAQRVEDATVTWPNSGKALFGVRFGPLDAMVETLEAKTVRTAQEQEGLALLRGLSIQGRYDFEDHRATCSVESAIPPHSATQAQSLELVRDGGAEMLGGLFNSLTVHTGTLLDDATSVNRDGREWVVPLHGGIVRIDRRSNLPTSIEGPTGGAIVELSVTEWRNTPDGALVAGLETEIDGRAFASMSIDWNKVDDVWLPASVTFIQHGQAPQTLTLSEVTVVH